MRIRILTALTGVLEGHSLSQFVPGYVYEVDDLIGAQLVELKTAIEVRATDAALVTDDDKLTRLSGGITIIQPDTAPDRPERRRRKRE